MDINNDYKFNSYHQRLGTGCTADTYGTYHAFCDQDQLLNGKKPAVFEQVRIEVLTIEGCELGNG